MESLEVNSLIIVESENDKYFIEAFLDKLNLKNIELGEPICNIIDFNCLGGYTQLSNKLIDIKLDKYNKIGIILDADNVGIDKRIDFINSALKSICQDVTLNKINKLKKSKELDLEIVCYITNVDGTGELETVMRKVKSQLSTYADCLNSWRECLKSNNVEIKDKEFDKFWVSNYLKYDTCLSRKDKKQKSKKCANELINNTKNIEEIDNNLKSSKYTIKKDIWDFHNPILNDLKIFLELLSK